MTSVFLSFYLLSYISALLLSIFRFASFCVHQALFTESSFWAFIPCASFLHRFPESPGFSQIFLHNPSSRGSPTAAHTSAAEQITHDIGDTEFYAEIVASHRGESVHGLLPLIPACSALHSL